MKLMTFLMLATVLSLKSLQAAAINVPGGGGSWETKTYTFTVNSEAGATISIPSRNNTVELDPTCSTASSIRIGDHPITFVGDGYFQPKSSLDAEDSDKGALLFVSTDDSALKIDPTATAYSSSQTLGSIAQSGPSLNSSTTGFKIFAGAISVKNGVPAVNIDPSLRYGHTLGTLEQDGPKISDEQSPTKWLNNEGQLVGGFSKVSATYRPNVWIDNPGTLLNQRISPGHIVESSIIRIRNGSEDSDLQKGLGLTQSSPH